LGNNAGAINIQGLLAADGCFVKRLICDTLIATVMCALYIIDMAVGTIKDSRCRQANNR